MLLLCLFEGNFDGKLLFLQRRQKEMFVKALALMPIRTLKRSDDLLKVPDSLCAICIEPYTVEDVVRELPCKYVSSRL